MWHPFFTYPPGRVCGFMDKCLDVIENLLTNCQQIYNNIRTDTYPQLHTYDGDERGILPLEPPPEHLSGLTIKYTRYFMAGIGRRTPRHILRASPQI